MCVITCCLSFFLIGSHRLSHIYLDRHIFVQLDMLRQMKGDIQGALT